MWWAGKTSWTRFYGKYYTFLNTYSFYYYDKVFIVKSDLLDFCLPFFCATAQLVSVSASDINIVRGIFGQYRVEGGNGVYSFFCFFFTKIYFYIGSKYQNP